VIFSNFLFSRGGLWSKANPKAVLSLYFLLVMVVVVIPSMSEIMHRF